MESVERFISQPGEEWAQPVWCKDLQRIKSIDALPIPACCLSFQEDVMVHEVFTETWQQSDKVCQVMKWN